MFKRLLASLVILSTFAVASSVHAQSQYPQQPITIVVPYPAGGLADILARRIGEKLRGYFAQPVVVENRTGAGGNIGTEFVARAAPDGYTLLCASQFVYSVFDLLYEKLNYDPASLSPISVLATYPTVLLGSPKIPVNSLAELIDYARKNPGKLNYASQGNGQIGHLTVEMLKEMAKVDIVHIPYRGSAPALNDLLAGQVDLLSENLLGMSAHIQAKKLKVFAVTGEKRVPVMPDVPAANEVVPGFLSEAWLGISAPKGTPKEITQKLSEAIARAINSPDLRDWILASDAEPLATTPDKMASLVRASRERWTPVIKAARIRAE